MKKAACWMKNDCFVGKCLPSEIEKSEILSKNEFAKTSFSSEV